MVVLVVVVATVAAAAAACLSTLAGQLSFGGTAVFSWKRVSKETSHLFASSALADFVVSSTLVSHENSCLVALADGLHDSGDNARLLEFSEGIKVLLKVHVADDAEATVAHPFVTFARAAAQDSVALGLEIKRQRGLGLIRALGFSLLKRSSGGVRRVRNGGA